MSDARVEVAICNRGRRGLVPVRKFEFVRDQRVTLVAVLDEEREQRVTSGGTVTLSVGRDYKGEAYLGVYPWDGAIRVRRETPRPGIRVKLEGSTFCGKEPIFINLYPEEFVRRATFNSTTEAYEESEGGVYGPTEVGQILQARLI